MASRTDGQEVPQESSHWAACSLEVPCAPRLLPRMPLPDTCGSWLGRDATPIFRTCSSYPQENRPHSTAWERQRHNILKGIWKCIRLHVKQKLIRAGY